MYGRRGAKRAVLARSEQGKRLPVLEEEAMESASSTEDLDYAEEESVDDISLDDSGDGNDDIPMAELVGFLKDEIKALVYAIGPVIMKEELAKWASGKEEKVCEICNSSHSDLSPCQGPK